MPFAKQWRSAMFPDFKEQKAYVDYKGSKEILHRMKVEVANHSTPEELISFLLDEKKRVYEWSVKKIHELAKLAKGVEMTSRRFDPKLPEEVRMAADSFRLSSPTLPISAGGLTSMAQRETEAGEAESTKDGGKKKPKKGGKKENEDGVGADETPLSNSSNPPPIPDLNDIANITHAALPAENVKAAADAVLYELLRFHECRNLNTDTIEHVVRRQFRYTPLQPAGKWVGLLSSEYDFMSLSIDEVFYLLSVAYERVKLALEGDIEKAKHPAGAVGSQTFDRRSVKYWVHRQDLPFVIARVIQHLPVSHIKDTYKEYQEAGQTYCLGQRISSVYVDNSNFLFYHRRLERLEGSSLIRFRWYSDTLEPDINTVKPNSDVFVEMKVHHEAWSGDRSTKRRFAVKEKDMDAYLQGKLSLEPAIEKLRKKNTPEKEISKFRELASDILAKIKCYGLQPVLRTQCCRAAFQRGQDQSVRVSIDTDLRMSSEDFGLGGHWRSTGEALGVTEFPYAVVEVKLQCAENDRIAPWIEELLKCRHMESVPKFSKYGHGIAALFGHTDKISRVPYWVHQVNADIRAAYKPEENSWDPTVGLTKTWYQRLIDRVIFGTAPPQAPSRAGLQKTGKDQHLSDGRDIKGISSKYLTNSSNGNGGVQANIPKFLGNASLGRMYAQMLDPTANAKEAKTYDIERRHEAFLERIPQKSVESICFGGYRDSGKQLTAGIPWQTGKAVKVPQKFDPKTLLTSERYMMKYVEKATLIAAAGIAIINFGNGGNLPTSRRVTDSLSIIFNPALHIYVGVCLCVTSVLIALYALMVFRARAARVYGRKKIRYDDPCGPMVLTFLIICTFAAIATNMVVIRYGPMLSGHDEF